MNWRRLVFCWGYWHRWFPQEQDVRRFPRLFSQKEQTCLSCGTTRLKPKS